MRVNGSTPFRPLVSYLRKRNRWGYRLHPFSSVVSYLQKGQFHRGGYRPHPFSPSCFISSKTTFSHTFTEGVTGSTPFHPLVSYLQNRHIHREGCRLHPFSSSCFISSKTTFSHTFTERVTGSTPFHPLVSYLRKRHFHRGGYRLHLFSSSCFISSKTAFSPRGLPAPPLFILLFHIFKDSIFTKRVTGSTPFHPLVSYLQNLHIHREGYRLHPFSSSCFISAKTEFSLRELPAPPLFILLFHVFKNDVFTKRVTGSTPFHPLVSCLQRRHFHILSPKGLPAPPLFVLLLHIFKTCIFTERVTGSTPFHPLVSYLQKRHIHRKGYRLHPFSSSCFMSSKTTFSPRELPAPPLFILLFHFFKDDIFTERVTGSTPFHPFVSNLQKRHFHRKNLPAPPLFILLFQIFKNGIFTERVTGSTPFHPLVSYLQRRHFHREGYRLHPFPSFCFISSKTAFSPRGLPAPSLSILLFHIFKNGILTEKVNYRLHPFSSSSFISSKTAFSPRGLPAPPLFILLFHIFKTAFSPRGLPAPPLFILFFHIFKDGLFTERGTGSTPFHPLVSYLQKRRVHREGYRLHPFSSSCFIFLQRRHFHILSPRGLPAPPLFILLFHFFKDGIFTEGATGSTPFHPLVSYLQNLRIHREGFRLHPFSSSCFISSKTAFSPRELPAPPLFIVLFHVFKNNIFTERVTGSTPFHPLL